MWTLVWVLLTPGGDLITNGVERFSTRVECNSNRMRVETQPLPMGQKVQAICVEIPK